MRNHFPYQERHGKQEGVIIRTWIKIKDKLFSVLRET